MSIGYDPSPGDPFVEQDLGYITETVCIITDKVYSHCQQRECLLDIEVNLEGKIFSSIKFHEGTVKEGTLVVTDILGRPNFKRVQFTLEVKYTITTTDGTNIEGTLPDILKDIVMFIPDDARDEFSFRIVVETSSKILEYVQSNGTFIMAVGVFVITKVVGKVQLLIPAFGYCPEPPECEEFSPDGDICERFDYEPFPEFFPPQFEDLYPNI